MDSHFEELLSILGPSPRRSTLTLSKVEEAWDATLPSDFKRVAAAYGDTMIDEFLFIYGPRSTREMGEWMSDYVARGESSVIVEPVLPTPGGMFMWGHTIEGDRLFLVPRGEGEPWTVSAFRRNWGDWHGTQMPLEEWLVKAFRGAIETTWLPEWPSRHTFEFDSD